jgi:hypothetical protein
MKSLEVCGGVTARVLDQGAGDDVKGLGELVDGVLIETLHLFCVSFELTREF